MANLDGDPAGFGPIPPSHPDYPTPAQLSKLKGFPTPTISILPDPDGADTDADHLDALITASRGLHPDTPAEVSRHAEKAHIRRRLRGRA